NTVHVLDASRAVGVVSNLLSNELRDEFDEATRADYARLREAHASKSREKKLVTLEQARTNRTSIEWSPYSPPKPEFLGTRVYTTNDVIRGKADCTSSRSAIMLRDLIPYIDWSPF